jgi:hypothetical protein
MIIKKIPPKNKNLLRRVWEKGTLILPQGKCKLEQPLEKDVC